MSDKITFKQLVELIAKQSKQSESSANSFIHELVQIIEGGLKKSGTISISGFGKFELRWMKERPGVNPQTGDKITIPGQNKVVFKPYKALRETVNKPFANLEPEVLSETPESEEKEPEPEEPENNVEETEEDPFGLKGVFGSEEDESDDPFDSDAPFDSNDPFEDDDDLFGDEGDPFGDDDIDPSKKEDSFEEEEQDEYDFEDKIFASDEPAQPQKDESVDDLIIERENPHFGKKESESTAVPAETETAVLVKEEKEERKPQKKEEPPKPEKREKVAPVIQDESKMAEEVQKSGSFKWSYAAAVIIVMIALIILFLMMQRNDEPVEQTAATNGDQSEQIIQQQQPSTSEDAAADNAAAAQQPEETVDEESPPANSGSPPQTELDTQTYSVQSGQSLWNIAESQLGNPYLWPVIYHLNEDLLDNPNQLLANADIEIPTFSDPDNLSEFEREQVALGYFSLYQWNRENNPDEAQYFLWAVGVFSQDLLDQPPSQVDSQDLAFARNR